MYSLVDAILLDANLDTASARDKVVRLSLEKVAVRRAEGLVVFWYIFESTHVINELSRYNDKDKVTVKQALDLHEYTANPVRKNRNQKPLAMDSVVIENGQFIGIMPSDARKTTFKNISIPAAPKTPRTPATPKSSQSLPKSFQTINTCGTIDFEKFKDFYPDNLTKSDKPLPTETFTAYPQLDAPRIVEPKQIFNIRVGLGTQSQEGTAGGPLEIVIPGDIKQFELDFMVVAEGFGMPQGARHSLHVQRTNQETQAIDVTLIAPDIRGEPLLSTLSVLFFYQAAPCGIASLRIAVIPKDDQPFCNTYGNGILWTNDKIAGSNVLIGSSVLAPDLTVILSKPDANPASGQYVWSFHSPHPLNLPRAPITRNLGTDSQSLGAHIIEGIQKAETMNMVGLKMAGLGKNVAEKIPNEFWPLLQETANVVKNIHPASKPSILFLTAEPHVPWELARLPIPLDTSAPPYLGCQVNMGRWPLNESGNPPLPPPSTITVKRLAVVVGDYAARSGWRKLEQAEKEGKTIADRYRGLSLQANTKDIKQLLLAKMSFGNETTGAETVHFACHGEAIQGHPLDASVILQDGQHLDPDYLTASPLGEKHHPFLFLNACQVGKAGELLGSFSGFAGESLKGGFYGFLAPLWSVDDDIAHNMAVEFYDQVFGSIDKPRKPISEVLRNLRQHFDPDNETNSSTRLAYVFYGHPGLTLQLTQEN